MKTAKKSKEKIEERKDKITLNMTFHEIISRFPDANMVFMKHDMFCAMGCPMAMHETLEQGALAHGIDVKKLLKELNDVIK